MFCLFVLSRVGGPKYLECHFQKSNDFYQSKFKVFILDRSLHSSAFFSPHTLKNMNLTSECIVDILPEIILSTMQRGRTLVSGGCWQLGLREVDLLPLSLS